MQILSSAKEIEKNICAFIEKFENISMSVAWASASSEAFKILKKEENKKKIQSSTVGLHFYQTDFKFIEEFLGEQGVKFYKKDDGVFHPKIYLFWNNEQDWISLTGSANFTQSALTKNDEIMMMFGSNNGSSFKDIKDIITSYYLKSSVMTQEKLNEYIEKSKKSKKETADDFKLTKSIKNMEWDEYYTSLKNDGQELQLRLNVLSKAKEYFQKPFQDLTELQRKNIGGVIKRGDGIYNWFVFGHMPVQLFASRLSDGDKKGLEGNIKSFMNISKALDFIPSTGEVLKQDFDKCMKYFKDYKGWGYSLSTVSRLLAMKRPDQFFCITGVNKKQGNFNGFQKYFGKPKQLKTYDDYWEYVVENVRKEKWYKGPQPQDPIQLEIWNARVALMDALFFEAN